MIPPDPEPSSPPAPPTREPGAEFHRQLTAIAMGLLILAITIHLLQMFATVLQQLFIAAFIAYAILPAHRWLVGRGITPVLSFLSIVVVFLSGAVWLGQMIYTSAAEIHRDLPKYEERLRIMASNAARDLFGVKADPLGAFFRAEKDPAGSAAPAPSKTDLTPREGPAAHTLVAAEALAATKTGPTLPNGPAAKGSLVPGTPALLQALGTFFDYLAQAFVVLIYLIFILSERGGFIRRIEAGFGSERSPRVMSLVDRINSSIEQYIAVKAWMSILAGVLVTGVLMAFGVGYPVLWGFLTFALNFIPYLGSLIATVLPVGLALVQLDSLWLTLSLLVVLLLIQNGIGYVLEPRIAGRQLDLSPLVIILSLAFWGSIWGIAGMILAVPLVVVIKSILENVSQTRPIAMLLSNQ